jgi:hypothetical protein
MSDQSVLQALQRELAIEKAARQELEVCLNAFQGHSHHSSSPPEIFVGCAQKQTVLKTRQLWHLREQQDKEVQQYQVC